MNYECTLQPGERVWVVERDEYGNPIEISDVIFLVNIGEFIVASYNRSAGDCREEMLMNALEISLSESRAGLCTGLSVHLLSDCYFTFEGAIYAAQKEEDDDDEWF